MNLMPTDWFKAAAAVPNVLLALSYQMNFFPIFKGMRKANDSRMSRAVLIGVVFCTLSYLMIGIMGYDYVGDKVQANFLNSLEYKRVAPAFFFVINAGFLLSIFFAFPIMFFGCRNNFIALVQLAVLNSK
jgi:amino acid permease